MRSQSLFNFFTKAAKATQPTAVTPAVVRPEGEAQEDTGNPAAGGLSSSNIPVPQVSVSSDRTGRGTYKPVVFRGGYTINTNDDNVDWTAQGDGSINVYGAKFTDDQYRAYNNVRSSLAAAMRQQEGLGVTEAQQRATRLANQWAADRAQVAAGGRAMDRWRHVDSPATNNHPATSGTPTNRETPYIPTAPASPYLTLAATEPIPFTLSGTNGFNPNTQGNTLPDQPHLTLAASKPIPFTLRGMNGFNPNTQGRTLPNQQPQQVETQLTPQLAQPAAPALQQTSSEPAPLAPELDDTTNSVVTPAESAPQPKAEAATTPEIIEAPAWDFRARALENRNKVAEGLVPINDYEGIYYKPGDMSGTIYKSNGEPWRTREGSIVNAKMLREDTNWFGANGNDIKHNIEQRYKEDNAKAFTPAEAAVLGFKKLPGVQGYYINSRGEIVDEFGYAEDEGTLPSDVDHSTWDDIRKAWREWAPDYLGLGFTGDRDDYK